MNRLLYCCAVAAIISFSSCKKSSTTTPDTRFFVGNWAGALQYTGSSTQYKFSLAVNSDNTVINIDSAFSNQVFPGTYTFTADSLKIIYANGTKWNLKFITNTSCYGGVLGYSGAVGTANMTKNSTHV
jgi:hypothetical protein